MPAERDPPRAHEEDTVALKTDVRADTLARVPMFREFGRRELGKLAKIAEEIEVRDGHDLCVQGEQGTWAFVLVDVGADVVVGGRVPGKAILRSGVKAGDRIVTDGVGKLHDGDKVQAAQ